MSCFIYLTVKNQDTKIFIAMIKILLNTTNITITQQKNNETIN